MSGYVISGLDMLVRVRLYLAKSGRIRAEHGRDLVLNAWCKLELRNRLKSLARCSLKCLFWTMFDVLVMF